GLPRYDSAIAFRISCELPLGGVDRESLHEPLDEIVVETLRCSAPAELEAAARRVVTAAWEEHLHSWTRGILTQLREAYERRLHYLGEAIADLEARRDHSEIAVHVVRRLGERLAVDF